MLIDNKDIRVFVCIPATGKSTLSKKDNRFIDFDKERFCFKHGYDSSTTDEAIELLKGKNDAPVNPSYNENFFAESINNHLLNNKIILLAPTKLIVDFLVKAKIPYCLVYSSLENLNLYQKNMQARGNSKELIEKLTSAMIEKYNEHQTDNRPSCKMVLKKGQYLSDVLLPLIDK